jgi:hypothetical protein
MHLPEIDLRFIQLCAQGWTYSRLMVELNLSKSTLIDWSRKHQFEIQNSHAIELEALREKWLSSASDRVKARPLGPEHATAHVRGPESEAPDREGDRAAAVQRSPQRHSRRGAA